MGVLHSQNHLLFHAYLSSFPLFVGNPAIGILKFKEKYYTFNTRDAAYSFAENPDDYIDLIREKAKKNAELIQLLELHQQFETLIPYSQVSRVGI